MLRKNIDECYILDVKELNHNNIERLFLEYGDFITIFVCESTKFQGVVTYGKWSGNYVDVVNKDCLWLYDNKDELIFNCAETIFSSNDYIRSIPVINKERRLIGSIEKYDSDEVLEKEILDECWGDFLDVFASSEMKKEINYLKEILINSNYIIAGKNYLTECFCRIFSLKYKDTKIEYINYKWDFAIDMEVKYSKIRRLTGYYGSRYVYSFYEFLNEINKLIRENFFSGWHYIKSGFYDTKALLKQLKTESITIKTDNLMTAEYMRYFAKMNFHIIKNKDLIHNIAFQVWWAGVYRQNFYNVIEVAYRESEFAQLHNYIKELKVNIKVITFYMPETITLNQQEVQTFSGKHKTTECFKNFFGDFDNENWLDLMSQNFSDCWLEGRGIVRVGNNFKGCTYYNGIRFTTDVPETYKNTIYFLGPCITMGLYAVDEETIESILQRKLNKSKSSYRVINLGAFENCFIKILKNVTLIDGDIVVVIMPEMLECNIKRFQVHSLEGAFKEENPERETLFWDDTLHCNARANQKIANYIYPYLESLIDIKKYADISWKENNIYTIINNDNDINKFEKEVDKYLQNTISKIIPISLQEEIIDKGAIVMNANPFTLGHQFLVEEAAKRCSLLYVFVVEEDKSFFKFSDRFAMIKEATAHLKNVIILPSGNFIISQKTLPDYFRREQYRNKGEIVNDYKIDCSLDIRIFGKFIAPKMGIKRRFVGEEPIDEVTCEYNHAMELTLPKYSVELVVLKRKCDKNGNIISASNVRKALAKGARNEVRSMVPMSTYNYLDKHLKLLPSI